MKKERNLLYSIVNTIIRIPVMGIVFLLFLHSIFSTSFLGEIVKEDGSMQATTRNIADRPIKHIVVFLVVTVAVLLLYRWIGKKQNAFFSELSYDVQAMRKLNIAYLFAAAPIGNAEELGLFLVGDKPFSDTSSYYEVWVYCLPEE